MEQLPPSARTVTITMRGQTVDGASWDQARDGVGKIAVINVWGQWCPPCVDETDQLQGVWAATQAKDQPVIFVGINLRDSPATAAAFLTKHGVTYPSISDQASSGQPSLALQGKAPATPSTLILDRHGRLAARILGPTTQATLAGLIEDVLAEPQS